MITHYNSLANKFAPKLYYVKADDPFRNISPELMIGSYWRKVKASVSWADVCIQYITFFKEQIWEKSILDLYLPMSAASHPNDYVPIFLYLKNEKPVRAVFDILHYDIVGEIDNSTTFLHEDKGPQFQVTNFYRGLKPLENIKGYKCLRRNLKFLDRNLLKQWYEGRTLEGNCVEAAKFVIVNKLDNPFQEITTFRDKSSLTGIIIEAVIYVLKLTRLSSIRIRDEGAEWDISSIASKVSELWKAESWEKQPEIRIRDVENENIEELVEFMRDNIFEEPRMLDYLKLPNDKIKKAIDILDWRI